MKPWKFALNHVIDLTEKLGAVAVVVMLTNTSMDSPYEDARLSIIPFVVAALPLSVAVAVTVSASRGNPAQ